MELPELLEEHVPAAVAAGVAVVPSPGRLPQIAWTPRDEPREPAFPIYSITKTILAAVAMLLAEEGRLSLDDRLARWCPEVPGSRHITIRQLLNHTAGVPDYGGLRSYHDAVRSTSSIPWTFDQFAAETFGRGLQFTPGTAWAYSNPGYMLVKRIVEQAAMRPFARLVDERIARPLGLARTFVPESVADLAALAPATSRLLSVDHAAVDVRGRYHPGWVSHGLVASTPSEIARLFDALAAGTIVSKHSLEAMTTCVPVDVAPGNPAVVAMDVSRPGYGLGLMGESPRGSRWGHNGGGPGYSASAFHAIDLGGVSVCAMAATEGPEAVSVVSDVLRHLTAERPAASRGE